MKVGIIGTGWIAEGLAEPREMPHAETLYIMQLMDGLRRKWGVRYPMDED